MLPVDHLIFSCYIPTAGTLQEHNTSLTESHRDLKVRVDVLEDK
jgi:hypothetical protein